MRQNTTLCAQASNPASTPTGPFASSKSRASRALSSSRSSPTKTPRHSPPAETPPLPRVTSPTGFTESPSGESPACTQNGPRRRRPLLAGRAPSTRRASAPADSEGEADDDEEPPAKKAKAESTSKDVPPQAGLSKGGNRLVIYTDGASSNNGKASARAGVGVFFGPGDKRYRTYAGIQPTGPDR
ncbi:hypothetical protein B0H67DRAFT_328483 [Lasiosphaeris hirsuta]|uniref:Uncharacterized protein n=1 Tax=Lasiosphaeris hirsuta TaxID=260670 RepID=A0AA40A2K2_9PEZI|nr:hypothetical protein B0H67DRAFT_328483 [Lasiosphaeris hirsuta]